MNKVKGGSLSLSKEVRVIAMSVIAIFLTIANVFADDVVRGDPAERAFSTYLSHYTNGEKEKALTGFTEFLRRYPKSTYAPEAAYILALEEREYFHAITKWQRIFDTYKEYKRRDEVAYRIGTLYLLHSNYKAAFWYFEYIVTQHAGSAYYPRALLSMGSIYLIREDYNRAIRYYIEAGKKYKKEQNEYYLEALYGIANTFFAKGQYADATKWYSSLVTKHTTFKARPFAMYRLGYSYEALGDVTKGLAHYKEVIRAYPDSYAAKLARQRLKVHKVALPEGEMPTTTTATNRVDIYDPDTPEPDEHVSPDGGTRPYDRAAADTLTYQLGYFRNPKSAQTLMQRIRGIGYDAYILEEKMKNVIYFRVRIDIANDEATVAKMKRVFAEYSVPYFLVKD